MLGAYIDRLNNVRTVMDEMIEQLSIRADKGLQLVDWMYPKIKVSATNVITGQPFDDSDKESPVWSDFQTKVRALELPESEEARLINGARDALNRVFKPAYLDFIAWSINLLLTLLPMMVSGVSQMVLSTTSACLNGLRRLI